MKRFLLALGLGLGFFALNSIFTPEEVASQIGYQTTSATVTVTDHLTLPDGTKTLPSLRFTSDADTGLYYTATGLNISVSDTRVAFFTSINQRNLDGAVGWPAYAFLSDTDSGMYLVSAGRIGFATGGTLKFNVASGGQVYTQVDGAVTAPSYTFGTDTDTGIYGSTGDGLAFSQGGKDLGEWYVAEGTLTATQVRKLNATPIEIIAAPAAGSAIVLESAQFELNWNANAYDNVGAGEDLLLFYTSGGGGAGITCDNVSCLNAAATADDYGLSSPTDSLGTGIVDASGIKISILSGEWAAADLDANGDSTIDYRIRYRLVATAITP
jgi:hypothetical protein